MCARLAAICNESGQNVSPYGGLTAFQRRLGTGEPINYLLYFENTPGHPTFSLSVEKKHMLPLANNEITDGPFE